MTRQIPRRHILEDISWDTLNIRPLYQASTGWEALALLLKHQPDILILDIRMPGLSGLQLLDELVLRHSSTKVITLSGYSDFEAARKNAFQRDGGGIPAQTRLRRRAL